MSDELPLTEAEAAALLGISRLTLKRARKRGAIEYTLLGQRLIRYTRAQIEAYMQRARRRAEPVSVSAPAKHIRRASTAANGIKQAMAILQRSKQ